MSPLRKQGSRAMNASRSFFRPRPRLQAGVTALLFCVSAFAQEAVPLRFDRNGIPIARVTLNGRPLEVGIDTGAAMTMLDDSSAKRVAIDYAASTLTIDAARVGCAHVNLRSVQNRPLVDYEADASQAVRSSTPTASTPASWPARRA